jgi:hypothetical protein
MDMSGDVGAIFDKYIDREEDIKIHQLSKIVSNNASNNGIRRRKKNRDNPFGVNMKFLDKDQDQDQGGYKDVIVDQEHDKELNSDNSYDSTANEHGKKHYSSDSDNENDN